MKNKVKKPTLSETMKVTEVFGDKPLPVDNFYFQRFLDRAIGGEKSNTTKREESRN